MSQIQLAALAEEKAQGMIAKAIAKSEIILSDGHNRIVDEIYYRLNIRPNDNQSGTEFWYNAAKRLLNTGECIIAESAGRLFIVQSYQADNYVILPKLYSRIVITDGRDTLNLGSSRKADDLIVLRYENAKIRAFRQNVLNMQNEVLQTMTALAKITNTPVFKYKYDTQGAFVSQDKNGQTKRLTVDQVLDQIAEQLTGKELAIIKESRGIELSTMGLGEKVGANELKSMAELMYTSCAIAYDIPEAVFLGRITEKSDATNEFITYAAQPLAEVISDALNSSIVGEAGYIKGRRAYVWLGKFKHIDVVDAANNLDKLRGDGFSLDEIRELVDYPPLNTEFSRARALTKNYETEGGKYGEENS